MDSEPAYPAPARAAVRLEYLTLVVAAGEGAAALLSGVLAHSVALVAFGADSVIELLSGVVVLQQLLALTSPRPQRALDEHRAHRILAVLFFALALYVTLSATWALLGRHHPHENAWGVGVSLASGVAMPLLAWSKRVRARGLAHHGFAALARLVRADAAETALCSLLALSTLVGVALAWSRWWWADPVASLAVVYFALREGREAWDCAND